MEHPWRGGPVGCPQFWSEELEAEVVPHMGDFLCSGTEASLKKVRGMLVNKCESGGTS